MAKNSTKVIWLTVAVAALGNFVDVYDLILFSVTRVVSLKALGVPADKTMEVGMFLLNVQMIGMLIGGILWGIVGDLRGRKSVLFGSILMYSLATLANAFVQNIEQYAVLRFIGGIGLAGELGAAITLVAEMMPKHNRGVGTTIVATTGFVGAMAASYVAEYVDWRTAYIIGGLMGLSLLALRASSLESVMFHKKSAKFAQIGQILRQPQTLRKYLYCILIGVPCWFANGLLVHFATEIAKELNVTEPVVTGKAILMFQVGLLSGDFCSGMLSQFLRSRKKTIFLYLGLITVFSAIYLCQSGWSAARLYAFCGLLGFAAGYWVLVLTVAAEQFGTNVRATVATSVPNFVRASVVPMSFMVYMLKPHMHLVYVLATIGTVVLCAALFALWRLQETFTKDLDYNEAV